jgi:hypothetical protein
MGLQLRTYVNGKQEYIELYGDDDVTIQVSFAEIQDITKKNSAYTKEFKVPGSKNNNYIFNYFFDINAVALDWNPKRKFEADLIYNGYELYNGYVRMNSVGINQTEKIYSVTFYSAIGDLAANIGDKGLCLTDTTSLNHSLYNTDVTSQIFNDPSLLPIDVLLEQPQPYLDFLDTYTPGWNNPVSRGEVKYILGQRGYDYTGTTFGTIQDIDTLATPILEFSGTPGFFDYYKNPVTPDYLIPSVRATKLYELIVNQAGYNIQSEFFDGDYMNRYYMPLSLNADNPYMFAAKEYDYQFINLSGITGGSITTPVLYEALGSPVTLSQPIFKTREIIKENMDFNPIDLNEFPLNASKISGFTDYMFSLPFSITQNYELKLNVVCATTQLGYGGPSRVKIGEIVLYQWVNTLSGTTLQGERKRVFNVYSNPLAISTTLNTTTFTLEEILNDTENGETLFFIGFKDTTAAFPGFTVNSVDFSIVNSPIIIPKVVELNKEMPCDYKQIQYIQDINKMFNLVVVEHPTKTNTLIIEPMVNYIGKGDLLDWTSKVDFNSLQTLTPTTSIINGSVFLANKQDKDFVNSEYNNKTNKIFGQKIVDLSIDFKNEFINITPSLGQNTDYYLSTPGEYELALPCYFVSKEINKNGISNFEYRAFRSLPRLAFAGVPIPTGNTGTDVIFYRYNGSSQEVNTFGLVGLGTLPNINRLTTYPFAVSGFSHYTIYNQDEKFLETELVYPEVDSQYDRYYRDYIEDLTSEENKIYSCKMYLTPWEVSQLYFNETIFVKNAKFRINKISNLSLMDASMCDVELVKLTRDYEMTPVLFYDLISCDDNCNVIHSHTDLNYLWFAFEGKYVDIITEFYPERVVTRFKVVRAEYNPDVVYEKVYFDTDITVDSIDRTPLAPFDYYVNWNYAIFDDCNESIQNFKLDVYNDFTGSTECECNTISVTNTGTTRQSFTYVDCSGVTSSYSVASGSTITVCGCYKTFRGSSFIFCPQIEVEGCNVTPLPTPTPTPVPPNVLNWYFSKDLGEYNPNVTDPNLELVQSSTSNVLLNTNNFGNGIVYFYSDNIDITASFVYQNNQGSINDIAIVAGTSFGDDTYGRLNIPNPSVNVTYTLNCSPYLPASGNLYVTIITY